jgi:cyclohexanone monooxygenase
MAEHTSEYEAIIIGAGFGGIRALHEMRNVGLSSIRVFERGTGVGGTWYWNRYPGARTDSEAWVYCYRFDKEIEQEWDWTERFPQQREVEAYLNRVCEKHDMFKDIQFRTAVTSAIYDEATNRWTVGTDTGETCTCQYLISATGLLHVALEPPFPGLNTFKGEWYLTSKWPKEPVDFLGKRVAVVGTGATAVQIIPEVAKDADQLVVFQRTANYVMPSRNHPLEENQRREIKRNYGAIWKQADQQVFAFPMDPANRVMGDMESPEQHRRVLEAGWESGGFRYIFETFDDLLIDEESNRIASEFVHDKIRAIVKDPETAELLCPTDHPLVGKRPPLGHHYYETFNRDDVQLVSVKQNPITEITENGVRLQDGSEYEVDMIIFALGFDAVTGALTHMDCRGRDGMTMKERWSGGAKTYLGICVPGCPNLYMISGPQSPFANIPVVIDKAVEFIGAAVAHTEEAGIGSMEPRPEVVQAWDEQCQMLMNATLLTRGEAVHSWFMGANVEGKAHTAYFYFGGAAAYFGELQGAVDSGFEGFQPGSREPAGSAV